MYSARRIAEPAVEPVTLDQVRTQCRLDPEYAEEDALLTIYVRAAREYVEAQTGRALIEQTWLLVRDGFPFYGWTPLRGGGPGWRTLDILLPRGRVLAVQSVQYFDMTEQLQTVDAGIYTTSVVTEPCSVQPAFGRWWPYPSFRPDAVQVTYTAGYGSTAADVPASLCQAILLLVGHWYENREATQAALTGNGPMPLPLGVDALLQPYTDLTLSYE